MRTQRIKWNQGQHSRSSDLSKAYEANPHSLAYMWLERLREQFSFSSRDKGEVEGVLVFKAQLWAKHQWDTVGGHPECKTRPSHGAVLWQLTPLEVLDHKGLSLRFIHFHWTILSDHGLSMNHKDSTKQMNGTKLFPISKENPLRPNTQFSEWKNQGVEAGCQE